MIDTDFPQLSSNIPQRGTTWSKKFFTKLYKIQGWKISGDIPNIPKAIVIVAPHTSNIDGWFTFLAVLGLGLKVTIIAKHTLFKPPFDQLMRWFGMIPINRDDPTGLIDNLLNEIQNRECIWIAVAPEGTRKHADHWKSGFYRIAHSANIPIIMVALDYEHKSVNILGTFTCTGHYQNDLKEILSHYHGHFSPKWQHRLSEPLRYIRD